MIGGEKMFRWRRKEWQEHRSKALGAWPWPRVVTLLCWAGVLLTQSVIPSFYLLCIHRNQWDLLLNGNRIRPTGTREFPMVPQEASEATWARSTLVPLGKIQSREETMFCCQIEMLETKVTPLGVDCSFLNLGLEKYARKSSGHQNIFAELMV